jgi:hypothetical protein
MDDFQEDLIRALERARVAAVNVARFTRFVDAHDSQTAEDLAREIVGLLAALRETSILGTETEVTPVATSRRRSAGPAAGFRLRGIRANKPRQPLPSAL